MPLFKTKNWCMQRGLPYVYTVKYNVVPNLLASIYCHNMDFFCNPFLLFSLGTARFFLSIYSGKAFCRQGFWAKPVLDNFFFIGGRKTRLLSRKNDSGQEKLGEQDFDFII